ncbi:MAG: hypothetical protein PHW19_09925 [Salinivirgaceae bacterium]|nr:hypothetical protein [Salinivirgaceae bacterium]
MVKLLLFIKHNFKFLWNFIEFINNWLFAALHEKRLLTNLKSVINHQKSLYNIRLLVQADLTDFKHLIDAQDPNRLEFFKPHGFDEKSIRKAIRNRSLLLMGVFQDQKLLGYFFLRCFWNKKCFVGRLVDQNSEGKGIGKIMNQIMYQTAWKSNFRCLSTISKNNKLVMDAHAENKSMVIRKELSNNYLFVEFLPTEEFKISNKTQK